MHRDLEPNLFVNLNLFLCYWLVEETPNTTHFHPLLWVTILSHFEAVDNEVEASFSNERECEFFICVHEDNFLIKTATDLLRVLLEATS